VLYWMCHIIWALHKVDSLAALAQTAPMCVIPHSEPSGAP
jgi:hypothetical protein